VIRASLSPAAAAGAALCLLTLAGCGERGASVPPEPPVASIAAEGLRVIAYYPAWTSEGDNPYLVSQIPAQLLTHVNYAFADVSEEGEVIVGFPELDLPAGDTPGAPGNFTHLRDLKEAHPHLKTLVSVGGWTWSGNFSTAAETPASRRRFTRSLVALVDEHGFDGADLDWEYPAAEGLQPGHPRDTVNFTLLLADVRAGLDELGQQRGHHYLLTIAAPAGLEQAVHMQIDQIHAYLDWINVMTYDFAGDWSEITDFNAALYASTSPAAPTDEVSRTLNADTAIQFYLNSGVPADKLVLGAPFGGKSWRGVRDENRGMYQPHEGSGRMRTSFRSIQELHVPTMERYWDDDAKAPWLYDAERGIVIVYEDTESIAHKSRYVREHGLGGLMFWQITSDDENNTLLRSLVEALR